MRGACGRARWEEVQVASRVGRGSTELFFFITYFFEMPGELFSITITKIIFRELVMAVIPSVTGGLRPPDPPAEFWNVFFDFSTKLIFGPEN